MSSDTSTFVRGGMGKELARTPSEELLMSGADGKDCSDLSH